MPPARPHRADVVGLALIAKFQERFVGRDRLVSRNDVRNLMASIEPLENLSSKLIPKRIRLGIGSKSQRSESPARFVFQSRSFGVFLAGNRCLVAILLGLRETEEQSR